MKKTILLSIASATFFIACKNPESHPRRLTMADWLQGNWVNVSPGGVLSESWQKENDSLFRGQSFFIKGKDTIHSEAIDLAEVNGEVVYSPTVQGQNNDKPVNFKLTTATDSQLVFENPTHDFPQKITYTKVTNDSIIAEISGVQQGKPALEKFPLGRLK